MAHINEIVERRSPSEEPDSGASESQGFRSPALRLPPELLTLIFRELQLLHGWNRSHRHPGSRLWLRVTWVCRFWREAALLSPTLWSFVQSASAGTDHAFVEAALERARRVPLNIDLTFVRSADRAPSLLASLFVHAQRIQVMRLQMLLETNTMQLFFESMAASRLEMPLLECLSIADRAVDDAGGDPLPYLAHLTREHVPRLHTLSLCFTHFPWNSSVYSSLLSLDLVSVQTQPTVTEFLHILRECPQLWKLHIEDSLADLAHQPLPKDPSVVILPWLEEMSFIGAYDTIAYVCDLLWVPCSCEVSIEYHNTYGVSDVIVERLVSAVLPRQHVFREIVPCVTSLRLRSEEFELAQDDTEASVSLVHLDLVTDEGKQSSVRFDSVNYASTSFYPDTWQELLDTFRRAPLTHIHFAPIDNIASDMWYAFFRQFPLLNTIEVGLSDAAHEIAPEHMHGILNLLHALRTVAPDSREISAPNLQCLTIKDFPVNGDVVTSMLVLVEARKAAGKPLQRLMLQDVACQEDISNRTDAIVAYFKAFDRDLVFELTQRSI